MARSPMALTNSLTLKDGRTLTLDLARITQREYRALFNKDQAQADEDATLAKVAGIGPDELLDLPQPEYRRLVALFFKLAREPLADPS